MTVTGVLAGLLAALSLSALIGWSAVILTRPDGAPATSTPARQSTGRVLLTVAAVSAGACLVAVAAVSFAEHL